MILSIFFWQKTWSRGWNFKSKKSLLQVFLMKCCKCCKCCKLSALKVHQNNRYNMFKGWYWLFQICSLSELTSYLWNRKFSCAWMLIFYFFGFRILCKCFVSLKYLLTDLSIVLHNFVACSAWVFLFVVIQTKFIVGKNLSQNKYRKFRSQKSVESIKRKRDIERKKCRKYRKQKRVERLGSYLW